MTPEDEVSIIQIRRTIEGLGWTIQSTEINPMGLQVCILKERKEEKPITSETTTGL